jgi:hypothetical protein
MARRLTAGVATVLAVALLMFSFMLANAPSLVHPLAAGRAERLEQAMATSDRLRALEEAIAAGRFGTQEAIAGNPAPGWSGEALVSGVRDDWEPAVAADPVGPFVYILTTRFGYPKPCSGNCPIPHISLHISKDGGRTWGEGRPLCACKGSWQYDPIIEVVADTGHIYAVYLNGFNVVFVKSKDHGKTWSEPVKTYGNISWNDKPTLATSADGRDVYVSLNGPQGGDPWIVQSHDFGATWTQAKLVEGPRYFFAYDGVVLEDGTALLTNSSLSYTGPGGAAEGAVKQHLFISRNRGATWQNVVMDSVQLGPPCLTAGCYADFHSGHSGLSADEDGDLVYVYDGAVESGGPQRAWVRTSTDAGRTWSERVALSRPGVHTTGPVVDATGNGSFRSWYVEQNDTDRWNVFYRSSSDGGGSWSPPVLLSDAISGAAYKDANGFLEFYGDYGEIAITSRGKTIGVWGEGFSWDGPGGVWFNIGS